jgi:hypothetical protein
MSGYFQGKPDPSAFIASLSNVMAQGVEPQAVEFSTEKFRRQHMTEALLAKTANDSQISSEKGFSIKAIKSHSIYEFFQAARVNTNEIEALLENVAALKF